MLFKPKNSKVRNGYTRSTSQGTFKSYQRDLCLDIEKYDGDTIVGKNPENGDTYIISIAEDTKKWLLKDDHGSKASEAPYNGRVIDIELKKKIPVGSRIAAERFESKSSKKSGDGYVRTGTVYQIWKTPAPQKEKCFPGTFTVSEYQKQLVSVMYWQEKGFNVSNDKAVNAFAKNLDKIHDDFKEKAEFNASKSDDDVAVYSTLARAGFALRAGYYVEETNETTGNKERYFKVFNYTPTVDSQSEKPEGLNYPLPVNGKDFKEYISDYKEYIKNDATLPKGVSADDVEIEFLAYKIFRITQSGSNSKVYLVRDFGSGDYSHPASALLNRKNKLSLEEDEKPEIWGNNFAVRGVLILASNTTDEVSGETITRNIVGHFFARGPRALTVTMVRSADDSRVIVEDELKVLSEDSKESSTESKTSEKSSKKSAPSVDTDHSDSLEPEEQHEEAHPTHEEANEPESSFDDDDIPF